MGRMLGVGNLGCAGGLIVLTACSSSSSPAAPADAQPEAIALPATLAVTADWLHHTVSLVDFETLVSSSPVDGSAADGSTGDASMVDASTTDGAPAASSGFLGEIGLSQYAQGPYSIKITPDGTTAIVTMSSGFFAVTGGTILVNGPSKLPTGPSEVLFIDLATQSIEASLATGDGATGIAITHDGTRAFVSHAGTTSVTIIDVTKRQIIQQVDVGGTFAEEISIDDSDTVGIVTYLDPTTEQKDVRTFAVADMASTLSAPIPLNTDAAGVPFFPGKKVAYVVLAYNPITSPASGYALIDATNPSAPVKLVETTWTDATYVGYQAIAFPARGTVLVPVATAGLLSVREYALGASDVVLQNTYPVVPTRLFGAFGAIVDSMGRMVLTMPGDRQIAVLDLTSGAAFSVPWFTQAGPLGIALR